MVDILWLLGCTAVLSFVVVFGTVIVINGFISLLINRKIARLERDFWDNDPLEQDTKKRRYR